ncbi:MAG TPA: hypothetical protein VG406_21235 [Isosphaeraceae bacterium]|jgi:hypothetical protein|nr:hypothetical protein [Isosphaeraceae bacterium]
MASDWTESARAALLELRGGGDSWGYQPGLRPDVEPTALAALALLADDPGRHAPAARAAADWLAGRQRPDGALGAGKEGDEPGWSTSYAMVLWAALGSHGAHLGRAARWLLGRRGDVLPRDAVGVIGHDTTIPGWPWVEGTHSWLEPTAWAVLALGGAGLLAHPRTRDGVRLIRDRALPAGGWNYGNNRAFGHVLRPQPATTGLALLALARAGDRSAVVARGRRYLLGALPGTRSAQAIGWGVLALRASGRAPEGAATWLAAAAAAALRRPESAVRLACVLLAAGSRAPGLFGIATTGDDHGDA